MGCAATKNVVAQELPQSEPELVCATNRDKVKFKQATVVDLLGAEKEENDRVLLRWASEVFMHLQKDDEDRVVRCSAASDTRSFAVKALTVVLHS